MLTRTEALVEAAIRSELEHAPVAVVWEPESQWYTTILFAKAPRKDGPDGVTVFVVNFYQQGDDDA